MHAGAAPSKPVKDRRARLECALPQRIRGRPLIAEAERAHLEPRLKWRAGEITISFGGDRTKPRNLRAAQRIPLLKGRFADLVMLDLRALEQQMALAVGTNAALVAPPHSGDERRLVEFPPRQIDLSAEGGQMLG